MPADEIVSMTAMALSDAIHARRLSCVEVMDAFLDRIERFNPRVTAIVSLRNRGTLLAEAADKDRDLAGGRDGGWMHGFPIAVKDLDAARGLPWTMGSPILAHQIAESDSIQAGRMRASGAILIGKTNTPEFGLGSQTFNRVFGPTRNPYDLARTAGGSSGGAAVALALRMLPVADGSDHGGSLRNPAAFNNVFGLRPSYGRVPATQEDVFAGTLGVVGPMARNPEDLAMLLSVQAGFHPQVPLSRSEDPAIFADLARGPVPSLKGKRIAWMGGIAGFPCEPGVLSSCREALKTFEALGCTVEEALPDFPLETVWRAWLVLRAWTVSRSLKLFYDRPDWRAQMKPEALWEVERGQALTTEALAEAQATRTAWYQAVLAFFARFDAMVLPAAQVFPFPVETPWPKAIGETVMDTYHRWMSVVIPGTMSGCPVIAMPAGFNGAGLPMGFQMICPMHREIDCLALARAYDAEARWSAREPPLVAEAGTATLVIARPVPS